MHESEPFMRDQERGLCASMSRTWRHRCSKLFGFGLNALLLLTLHKHLKGAVVNL